MSFKQTPLKTKIYSGPVQETPTISSRAVSKVTKWLPFICAGTAVGISILAIKEIKKIKDNMVAIKNQKGDNKNDAELSKKMNEFEIQLKKMNEMLMNNQNNKPKIIKSFFKTEVPTEVNIINEQENQEEYEEIEVTDDEVSDEN
jgi:hypothetical protein